MCNIHWNLHFFVRFTFLVLWNLFARICETLLFSSQKQKKSKTTGKGVFLDFLCSVRNESREVRGDYPTPKSSFSCGCIEGD
jgi:hypothetical protein